MSKRILIKLLLILTFFQVSKTLANGIGAFSSITFGNMEYLLLDYDDHDFDYKNFSLGFIYDNMANRKVFNYRLNIGLNLSEHKILQREYDPVLPEIIYSEYSRSVFQFVVDNSFGFGYVRANPFRLWLGPTLRLGYSNTKGNSGVVLGIGSTILGANFNISHTKYLSINSGVRFLHELYFKEQLAIEYSSEYGTNKYTFRHAQAFEVFFNLSFIFKLNGS